MRKLLSNHAGSGKLVVCSPSDLQTPGRGGAFLAGLLFFIFAQVACASPWKTNSIYSGSTLKESSAQQVAQDIQPGTVVIVSEMHGFEPHHDNQVLFLETLAQVGLAKISVGMEFFARGVQNFVDQFTAGLMGEADFLEAAGWGGIPFDYYRRQVLFPNGHGGRTIAINASRTLTGKISKVGLAGLSAEEKAELPPGFTLGNAGYRARFSETMQGHVPEVAIQRYFEAQSVWDEVMAYETTQFLRAHPDHVFVIIVGDFHAAYGGGLPDRLRARGASRVVTISQVNLDGLSTSEEDESVQPHSQWGARGDYVWVAR